MNKFFFIKMRHFGMFTLTAWAFLCLNALAEADKNADPVQDPDEAIIEQKQKVSKGIDDAAKSIDIYLANKKYVDTENKTKISIFNSFTLEEGGKRSYTPQLGARLHLPNLQRKLQLNFTTYDEDEDDRGINENRYHTTPTEKNLGTSLSVFQDLGRVKAEFRPRVEYRDEWQTSYIMKFSSSATTGIVTFKPQLQLFARSDKGTGQFVGTNVDLQLTSSNILTLINEEQYTDSDNTLSTNHGFKWDHRYSEDMSHEYGLIFESNNRAKYHLERYVFSSSFKQKLYIETLHYALTPSLAFNKEARFHPAAALNLRIELIF